MDWGYIQSFLYNAGKFVFLTNFILLLLAVMLERKVSSIVISLLVLSLANGIMSALTPVLYEVSAQNGIWHKFAWYGGFAFIDCIAIYLLFKLHKLLKQNVSKVAQLTGCAFLTFTFLQSARFIDRFVFDSEMLAVIYRNAIPALNLVLIPLIIYFWLEDVRNRKLFSEGVTS